MNKQRKAILTYLTLFLLLVTSALLLGFEVKHYLYEQEDPLAGVKEREPSKEEVLDRYEQDRQRERNDILFTFAQTKAFTALATPVPFPTATPLPPPSPTPVVPARGWKVHFASPGMVILQSWDNLVGQVTARPGEVVSDPAQGDFKILEGIFDYQNTAQPFRVKVQDVNTGVVGFITEQAAKQ